MKGFRQRVHDQLSRAKDNKSSKKKDSNSTPQNQSLGISSAQQPTSPSQGTPTSSTTSLNDSRNKSPDNASPAGTPSAGAPHPGTPVQHYIPQPGTAGQPPKPTACPPSWCRRNNARRSCTS
ncbi:hypothetical protein DTO012A8_10079 [Penicillium roqueforti]|nr:hypothetical protein DTO012A8_10079 [Penicillium roqueforti]